MVQPANKRLVTEATVPDHVATAVTTDGPAKAALNATYLDKASGLTKTEAAAAYAPKGLIALTSDSQNIAVFGDSLTQPGKWGDELAAVQGINYFNGGKSGQSSTEVGIRQGGIVPKVTIPSGSIPASGPVAVTVDEPLTVYKENVQGAMSNPVYVGTIAGIPGTLTADIQGSPRTWSFTRATTGTAVTVTGQRYFVSTEGPLQVGKEQIFWVGRNFSGDKVVPDVQAMVDYLKQHVLMPRYIVVSIITSDVEVIGTNEYYNILRRNTELKAAHGEHFVEVRRPLIDNGLAEVGITPTAGDLEDIANDTVPRSLRVDNFHLTDAAQRYVGRLIAEHRTRLGYNKTAAIRSAFVQPAVTPAVYTLTESSGVTHRYVPKMLAPSTLDTVIVRLDSAVGSSANYLRPVVTGSGATHKAEGDIRFLRFDGVDDRMYMPAFTQAQPFTVAVVYRLRSEGTTKAILSLANGTPTTPILRRESTGNIAFSAGTVQTLTPATALGTGWHIAYASVNGASTIIGVDGATTVADVGAGAVGGIRIGQGASDYSDIDVAEVILWSRALTAPQLATVRTEAKVAYPALP